MSTILRELLDRSSARHSHLCPRQVLGVRMALAGLEVLGIQPPITRESGLVIVETDGCFADGVEIASGATVGHRTLRVEDLGKIAAVFANVRTGRAVRLSPRADARLRAQMYAGGESRHYFAQLQGYQEMPADELFRVEEVRLEPTLTAILSKPGLRVACEVCGEEIINERQVVVEGTVMCRTCAQGSYYVPLTENVRARIGSAALPILIQPERLLVRSDLER